MPSMMSDKKRGSYFRPWSLDRSNGATETSDVGPASPKIRIEEDQSSVGSSLTFPSSSTVLSRPGSSLDSNDFHEHTSERKLPSISSDIEARSLNVRNMISAQTHQSDVQLSSAYQCPVYSPDYWHSGSSFQPHKVPVDNVLPGQYPHLSHTHCPSLEEAVFILHQQEAVAKQLKKLRPKKYKCPECGVAFSNNGQLSGHVRIHTGERPFKCDFKGCEKTFTRNEELTRHRRIHTGAKPHKCIECGKKFGRKDHLKKHMRTHDQRRFYYSTDPFELYPLYNLPEHTIHPIAPYFYPI